MRSLALTVLFEEGPIARGYLAALRRSGLRAQKIFRMVPGSTAMAALLPARSRITRSAARQHRSIHSESETLAGRFPDLFGALGEGLCRVLEVEPDFIDEIRSDAGLDAYADTVVPVEVNGAEDPGLARLLAASAGSPVLFTGRGTPPGPLVEVLDNPVLHVHPGYLPDIRGDDALLWQSLVRGCPGASVVAMYSGAGYGDLVSTHEFEPLDLALPAGEDPDDDSLYAMIRSVCDPVLRAVTLARVLTEAPDLTNLATAPMDPSAGRAYHTMEARLRHLALKRIFLASR